jgi:hypothetical protein
VIQRPGTVVCKRRHPRRRARVVRRSGPRPLRRLLTLATVPGLVTRERVRRIAGRPYLYLRQYQGAAGHGRPRYADLYLGAVPERLLRQPALADLRHWATRQRARLLRRLESES